MLACTYLILGRDAGQRSFDIRRQTSDSHSAGRPSGFAPGGASRRDARSVFLEDSGTPRAGRAVVWEGASALQKFPFAFAFVLPVSTGCG